MPQPLFEGAETREEVHRKLVWGGKSCTYCGATPVVAEIRVFYPADVLRRRDEQGFDMALKRQDGFPYPAATHFNRAKTNGTQYFRAILETVYPCAACRKMAEQAAARHHSAALVEVDTGRPLGHG